MSHIIKIDTSQLHEEFERTLDEVYLTHHYHQTNIPKGIGVWSENDRAQDHQGRAAVRQGTSDNHSINGLPAGWNQDGGTYQQFGGGAISGGCVVGALLIGVAIAIGIILAGML